MMTCTIDRLGTVNEAVSIEPVFNYPLRGARRRKGPGTGSGSRDLCHFPVASSPGKPATGVVVNPSQFLQISYGPGKTVASSQCLVIHMLAINSHFS